MDATRFTTEMSGRLVRIELPQGKDWAFVPNPLPREWEVPSRELHDLLGDAREMLGTLNGIGQTLLNPFLLLRPLQQREAIRSSSLEGTHVHALDLLQYEKDPAEPTSEQDERNAWKEVWNYNVALQRAVADLAQLPLCNRLIQQAHSNLLAGVRGLDKRPGAFRDRQVHVGSDRRFVPPPSREIPELMADLERFLNANDSRINPLIRSYMAHYQFEAIHPFLDGNGRIGRVLLALCTYTWHHHTHPWLYMSAYFDRYKDEYIDNLFRVSTHGDWSRWIDFCLRGTVVQCEDTIRRCQEMSNLRIALHARADNASPRMHQIIDSLFEKGPVLTVRDVMNLCSVSRPTAQKEIGLLVEQGVAQHLAGKAPRKYFVPSILDIAYSEPESLIGVAENDHQTAPE